MPGKPKIAEKIIGVRFTDDERSKLESEAKGFGIDVSTLIRRALDLYLGTEMAQRGDMRTTRARRDWFTRQQADEQRRRWRSQTGPALPS